MNLYELLSHRIPARCSGTFWSGYLSTTPLVGTFSVTRYTGVLRNTTDSASIVLAGRSSSFHNHITSKLFIAEPAAEALPVLRSWNLRRQLKKLATDHDLVFSQTGRFLAPHLFGPDFLLLPAWVGHLTQLPASPEEHKKMLSRVDGDLFLIRRNKLRSTMDRAPSSLDTFYRDYYQPTVMNRHGSGAIVQNLLNLRRFLSNGAILWIDSPVGRIAGVLIQQVGSRIVLRSIGLHNGDLALAKQGAIVACYYHAYQFAIDSGSTSLDFRGTRPSLTDGVLRYKRKWGAAITDSPDLSFEDMAVHWSHPSPAVHAFFELYGPIFRHHGKLMAASSLSEHVPPGIEAKIHIDPHALPTDSASFLRSLSYARRSQTAKRK